MYGFRLQNHSYSYVKDAFGSIVAIIDLETGSAVKELGYTAFGQLIDKSQSSTLTTDSANPLDDLDAFFEIVLNQVSLLFGTLFFDNLWMDSTLIYKDYAYDSDTGMYYLQSRYYDPEVSRFINMDDTEILKVIVGTLNGANLFAYCNNDPVLNSDPSGYLGTPIQWAFSIIGAILGVPFGKWIAHKLGYTKGWKYNAIRVAAVVGGAALGWFAGSVLLRLIKIYLSNNPQVMIRVVSKYGSKMLMRIKTVLGLNLSIVTPRVVAQIILKAPRVGSALNSDLYHRAASWLSVSQLAKGTLYRLSNGRILLQVYGTINGKRGVFEYIIDELGQVCHQLFKEGGTINGIPNK